MCKEKLRKQICDKISMWPVAQSELQSVRRNSDNSFFLATITSNLFPLLADHFWAKLKMKKFFKELCMMWSMLSPLLLLEVPLLTEDRFLERKVDADDVYVSVYNSFWQIDQNNSFLAMHLSVNLVSWSFKVMTFKI